MNTEVALEWHGRESELAQPGIQNSQQARYWNAYREGDPRNTCLLVGESIGLIREAPPAKTIVDQMMKEADRLLCHYPGAAT